MSIQMHLAIMLIPFFWWNAGCIPRAHQADIAFLLDTSSSVYEPDFEKMKLFLANLIKLFNVSQSEQRISSATFSDDVRVNFHLDDYNSNSEVEVRNF